MKDILDEMAYENKESKPASVLDRLLATFIDVLLFFIVTYFLNGFFIDLVYADFLTSEWYILSALVLFYILFFQSSEMQATIGMQLMNIRLLNEDKTDVKVMTVMKRMVINIILFFNFLFLFGPNKQSFADRVCKTFVVRK